MKSLRTNAHTLAKAFIGVVGTFRGSFMMVVLPESFFHTINLRTTLIRA